ncbi:N-6 DNA methylase [Streptomyces radicis]|uniref:SAM-dependent methyltransferase n=1 Tax=Streptomyces radicis TaxID=1750517 RepID=A0A3A9WGX9_9ACTN|nr:N-6 DNA methylase [Streptomyces radicis]RKN08684.1 SAM-dependent methyltransferase [Streptomyces radicis]RKN21842.1 SAM-dependent methyltransferase [Streptomyces radicis]
MPGQQTEVTAAGIARLAGVGRAAVSNWRRRYAHFPRPIGGTEASPTFSLAEVERWLRDQGKLAEVPLRERLWGLVAADPAGQADALARVGEQLIAHGERAPEGADPLASAAAALAAEAGPAPAFEFLLARHLDTAARQLTRTPQETAALMAALAGPADTVLDPACGPCTLLAAARAADGGPPAELYGQDTDATLVRLGGLRLALRGTPTVRAVGGDTLTAEAFPRLTADAVLCHPPFNERNWGHDQLTYDPRWEYGVPARTESELAWVQHALARLRPGGTAVLLMPPAAASRRTGRRVRAALLRRGALRAVVALPAGAAPPHSLPLHLWILRAPGASPAPDPRLLVVDTATAHRARGRGPLDWPALRRTVEDAWTAFDRDGDLPERPGTHRALPVIDLLDEDVDLAPGRHLPPPAETGGTAELAAVHQDLRATLRRTHDLAPGPAAPGEGPAGPRWTTLTIGELARTGALEIHTAPTAPAPGDVLVPLLLAAGPDGAAARVVTEDSPDSQESDGGPPDRHTCLLRPAPDALDPWFLAGFLRSTANTRQASSYASSATRVDVRRLKVPRLPLDAQRRYGRRFRDLVAFEAALRQAAGLGRTLVQGTVDGLTEGALDPGD